MESTRGIPAEEVWEMRLAQEGRCACGASIAIVAYLKWRGKRLWALECAECHHRKRL